MSIFTNTHKLHDWFWKFVLPPSGGLGEMCLAILEINARKSFIFVVILASTTTFALQLLGALVRLSLSL
jgi:hypothetical protein